MNKYHKAAGKSHCVHFIGFTVREYWSAMRVWGKGDYWHERATWSCLGEIDAGDTVIFGSNAFPRPRKWRKGAHHLSQSVRSPARPACDGEQLPTQEDFNGRQ